LAYPVVEEDGHAVGIHRFTGVELEILESGKNLFGVSRGSLFKGIDPLRVCLLEFSLDGLHVALEMSHVALLVVWGGGLEPEGMDNIVDFDVSLLEGLLLFLSRGVSTCRNQWLIQKRGSRIHSTDVDVGARLDNDHRAINLIDDIVDEFSKSPSVN
jgi:hypothetical protein